RWHIAVSDRVRGRVRDDPTRRPEQDRRRRARSNPHGRRRHRCAIRDHRRRAVEERADAYSPRSAGADYRGPYGLRSRDGTGRSLFSLNCSAGGMMYRRISVILLLMFAFATGAIADPAKESVEADASTRQVAITSSYTGTEILVFGTVENSVQPSAEAGTYDVVVVVEGTAVPAVVRRKSEVGGLWVNTSFVRFASLPSYYAIASTRPIDEFADHAGRIPAHGGNGAGRDCKIQRSADSFEAEGAPLHSIGLRRGLHRQKPVSRDDRVAAKRASRSACCSRLSFQGWTAAGSI